MLPLVFLFCLQLAACRGLQWAERFQDNSGPVEVCSGQNIRLFWNYTLAQGERVKDMVWTCQPEGKAAELLASYADDNFVPVSELSGRLSHLQDGGIELSCATILESGNYTVAVTTVDNSGTETVYRQTAWVKVVDTPKTQSGELEVGQERTAVLDDASDGRTTGQWHVHLTCGHFSDRGHPPVDVQWKTPSGETLSSSYFHDGNFHLLLSNPVKGGKYTCSLPSLSPATRCLPAGSALRDDIAVDVDEVAARLSVMEAHQTQLQERQTQMEKEKERLQDVIAELKNETHTLRRGLATATLRVSFHARLTSTFTGKGTLKPFTVITNEGDAFNGASGVFTAPRNGTYVFVASAGTVGTDKWVAMYMKRDGVDVSRAVTGQYSIYNTMGSVQATLYLTAGQHVSLYSGSSNGNYLSSSSSFTGFLLNADDF